MNVSNGDIVLVHTKNDWLATKVQYFQQKQDESAGYYNHSGLIYRANGKTYLAEMGYSGRLDGVQKLLRASFTFTPIEKYLDDDHELLLLKPKDPVNTHQAGDKLFEFVGIPYEYKNLLRDQIIRIVFNKWLGRTKNSWKKMVCHELSMTYWNELRGYFPECYKSDVAMIYHAPMFTHHFYDKTGVK